MEIPAYEPFYLLSVADLRAEIGRLGLEIPLDEDPARLALPLRIGRKSIPNRFCAQPIAGGDALPGGGPGDLTRRRYRRYAEGRFGLIWVEMTASSSPENPGQLCLNGSTLAAFRGMVEELRAAAADAPAIILQLALSASVESTLRAAMLAAEAGFDGVDFQGSRDALPEVLAGVRKRAPDLLLATRLCVFEAVRGGFGVSPADFRKPDMAGPARFVQCLRENGLALLNVTAASPRLHGPDRGTRALLASEKPDEHPLMALGRQLRLSRTLREAVPGLPVAGSGFSWLRQFVPEVAAGALRDGMIDFAGLGRGALAYPSAPSDTFARGRMDAGSACMVCFACTRLREEGEPVGCVLRDPAAYGPVYRKMRRFDTDRLLAGAARCHLCESAPCTAASATRTDIPAFIQAFRDGDECRAYEIIRRSDPLPEMTALLSPAWIEREGACIETALTGTPVPIIDLQYAISWRARDRGESGVRLPPEPSGKRAAIVGGGPTGLAAAIRLLELGHSVDLYEQTDRLGGIPARVIFPHRISDPRPEIAAVLRPALAAARLALHFGTTLGSGLRIEELQADHDAVLVATGLWQESSLGQVPGVTAALPFLETPGQSVPDRVAVLAGGDCAMDAARVAQNRGAKEIFVLFGGPRSAMHWHMPESWFASPGVQAMMNWQPLGYVTGPDGRVSGVRLRHAELRVESVLPVGLVIEATDLHVSDGVRAALAAAGRVHTAGALTNGGASVSRCVAEGLAAATSIHRELFP